MYLKLIHITALTAHYLCLIHNVYICIVCDLMHMQGTFCNVPSACDGVALADGTCCMFELARSGTCCEVVDKDMECCDSGILDAAGVCQGTAVSIDYNGKACTVSCSNNSHQPCCLQNSPC